MLLDINKASICVWLASIVDIGCAVTAHFSYCCL